jgi:hypothetical protein
MSGEHTHPDLDGQVASLRADLLAAAARLNRLTAQVVTLEAEQAAMREGLAAMAVWHDYSGKPDSNLKVPAGDYVALDVDVKDPPRTGAAEFHLMYVNATLNWKTGGTTGVIRTRYTREGGDDTAYSDRIVTRGTPFGSPDSFLITDVHFEVGQAGVGGRWWIRCGGDLASLTLTTRYAKIMQIS